MASQSYQKNLAGSAPTGAIAMPRALWGIVAGMVIGALLLIALPVAMFFDRDHTERSIMADQPDLDPSHLGFAFWAVTLAAGLIHLIDVVLTLWFGVKVLRGRRWARIALTIYLVVATIGSLFSAAAVPTYVWAVIPGDGIHLMMLFILWVPTSVREFFAAHRAGTRP